MPAPTPRRGQQALCAIFQAGYANGLTSVALEWPPAQAIVRYAHVTPLDTPEDAPALAVVPRGSLGLISGLKMRHERACPGRRALCATALGCAT